MRIHRQKYLRGEMLHVCIHWVERCDICRNKKEPRDLRQLLRPPLLALFTATSRGVMLIQCLLEHLRMRLDELEQPSFIACVCLVLQYWLLELWI